MIMIRTEDLTRIDGFWCRPGTTDRYAVAETRRIFRKEGAPQSGDVCLDLGAHIGSFSGRAVSAGATVVAVEPEPTNCAMFRINVPDTPLIEAAVGPYSDEYVDLYLSSTYGHTTTKTNRSRPSIQVPTVSFEELCYAHQPTFIKIDVEGAEYELGLPRSIPASCDRVFIEFHLTFGNRPLGKALHAAFIDEGWHPLWENGSPDRANMEGVFAR